MTENKNIKEVIELYNGKINSIIKRFCKADNDIEDIKQEVLTKTWKNIDKCREESKFKSWLNQITVNTCRDYLRSNKKTQHIVPLDNEISEKLSSIKHNTENKAIANERQKTILEAINKLSPKFKEVIILHDVQEFTQEAIAEKINCPLGTVKSRLFNARKILRRDLDTLLN